MLDDFCKAHIEGKPSYCSRINMKTTHAFCRYVCKGDWQEHYREDAIKYRETHRPELTAEQKQDKDIITVIIPSREGDRQYLIRTIKSVRDNAVGPIEVVVIFDGGPQLIDFCDDIDVCIWNDEPKGQRVAMNEAAKIAKGKYLFRLDAHCGMSPAWDARMKSSCCKNNIVTTVFDHLDLQTWQGQGRDTAFWMMDANLRCVPVRPWKSLQKRKIEEEAMVIPGCAWLIRKDYYDEMGGSDESLGGHGAVGPEWGLKVWLTGGSLLIRTDVVCYHLFRENWETPFTIDVNKKKRAFVKLKHQWVFGNDERIIRPIQWLLYKFNEYVSGYKIFRIKEESDAII